MCCQGDPTKFQELLSPEQQALRKKLIGGISTGLGQGATPYGGPVSAGIDPMSLMAANVMMGIGTKGSPGGQRGYTAPNFYGMQGGQSMNPWAGMSTGGGGGSKGGPDTGTPGGDGGDGGLPPGASPPNPGYGVPNPWNPYSPWGAGGGGGGFEYIPDWMGRGRRGGRYG